MAAKEFNAKEAHDNTMARLARMESRICQLMLHMGVSPKGMVNVETKLENSRHNDPPDRNGA